MRTSTRAHEFGIIWELSISFLFFSGKMLSQTIGTVSMLRGRRVSPSRHKERTGSATSGGAADRRLHVRMQYLYYQGKHMQGGNGPTGGDGIANARRLEVEVRVELRHAAHGCPMAVEADLTCEQSSVFGY